MEQGNQSKFKVLVLGDIPDDYAGSIKQILERVFEEKEVNTIDDCAMAAEATFGIMDFCSNGSKYSVLVGYRSNFRDELRFDFPRVI